MTWVLISEGNAFEELIAIYVDYLPCTFQKTLIVVSLAISTTNGGVIPGTVALGKGWWRG
jgi:hypothetical protein